MRTNRLDEMGKRYYIAADRVEDKALEQFEDVMGVDFVERGALMADAHAGYVAPIGSVIKTNYRIVPAWVGYDIGCTDKDTEYLTKNGWKKISEYDNEEILQYDLESDTASFAMPQRYIQKDCEWFTYFDNGVVNQMLSDDHKMLIFKGYKKRGYKSAIYLTKDLISKHKSLKKGIQGSFKTTFDLKNAGISLSDDEIRLQIAISADGSIRKRKTIEDVVEFHLKKQRKIDRLLMLLDRLGITPRIHTRKNGNFSCAFTPPLATKSLSFLWEANQNQLKVAALESAKWDGHTKSDGRTTFSSNRQEDIDIIQFAFAANNIRANYHKNEYDNDWNPTTHLYTTNNNMTEIPKMKDIKRVKSIDGKAYCFTTETGYWVQRRNGKISITGNCGVAGLKFSISTGGNQKINLAQLKHDILEQIPVGFDRHKEPTDTDKIEHVGFISDVAADAWYSHGQYQLGTLGGGNHFLEFGASNDDDNFWIIVHSGSRKLGHSIAEHYMKQAYYENNPDKITFNIMNAMVEFDAKHEDFKKHNPEKFYEAREKYANKKYKEWMNFTPTAKKLEENYALDMNSKLGQQYIDDIEFARRYATANRDIMISIVRRAIASQGVHIINQYYFNQDHNHAIPNLQTGEVIHRKGAARADYGVMNGIPANMKDGTFIVRGLGNSASLNSSSHGAGRVMSRVQARNSVHYDVLKREMEGIVTNLAPSMTDEAPEAYKDINEVMENQSDLVKIIDKSTPLLNIKG